MEQQNGGGAVKVAPSDVQATDDTKPSALTEKVTAAAAVPGPGGGETQVVPEKTEEEKARARAVVEEERARLREISAGGRTPIQEPGELLARLYSGTVRVNMMFPKELRYTLKNHVVVLFTPGVHAVPAELKDDWWFKNNGVKEVPNAA